MSRPINLRQYGVTLTQRGFRKAMWQLFRYYTKISVDELLVHPEQAVDFCRYVKGSAAWCKLPNELILRTLLRHRKSGAAKTRKKGRAK